MPGDDELLTTASSVPVANVVRQYVEMQPVGRHLVGKCPFHVEQTPSFMVRPSAGTFRCFGCWAQGDVIEFVMRVEPADRHSPTLRQPPQRTTSLNQTRQQSSTCHRQRAQRAHRG